METFLATYGPACIIGTCLLGFTLDFFFRFLRRAMDLSRRLKGSIAAVEATAQRAKGPVTELDALAASLPHPLDRLWHEYAKTLHPQTEPDELGQVRVARWRATATAEAFFTQQSVVDAALGTDYYKHLPGILTGLGILGTFSGLIRGLLHFSASADSGEAEESLRRLMHAVGDAFIVSGAAILLAILLTAVEKLAISLLYRKLQTLRQAIDALFVTGAQDEYLERIVRASETSATQAVQLKDALVSDLRQILTDITAQQTAAAARHSNLLSADVGKAIAGTMAPITQAFESVRANQGEAVSKLLVDVLANFSGKIEELFGGQMAATQSLLESTNGAVQATAGRLENMQQQVTMVVEELRKVAANAQSAAADRMQQALTAATQEMAEVVGKVQAQVDAAASRQEEQAGRAFDGMSSQVELLVAESAKTNRALQVSVTALSSATTDCMTRMQDGAKTLEGAADDLARTATRVSEALRLAGGTVESMREAADSLAKASVTTGQVSSDHARSRDVFAGIVSDLKVIVENARIEAREDVSLPPYKNGKKRLAGAGMAQE